VKTAFIVLTYNRPDALLQVLRGLAAQCDDRHEVLIADDGSAPTSVEAVLRDLPKFRCPVRHIWHPDIGFTASRARNMAAAQSNADYLVFLDGDCVPNPDFVEAHEKLRESGCFVNGNRVLLSQSLTLKVVAQEVNLQHARWPSWIRWRLSGDANKVVHLIFCPNAPFRKEQHFRWKQIRSCNFGVWRDDFVRVNGFDESFQGWGHEDADLVLRLHHAGLQRKNGFCASEVYHLWHKENSRNNEPSNRNLVIQRMQSNIVRAVKGVENARLATDVVVTKLN
jgi:GT2 family glycosyltransferase